MTTEANGNDNNSSENEKGVSPEPASACGPGCACENPAGKGSNNLKIAICLIVIVAVAGILVFKTTNARQNPSLNGTNGYSNPLATTGKQVVTNSAGQQGGSGAPISTIADLNKVADKLNTVFLVIPGKDNVPTSKETGVVLASVERTLNAKGLSTGIFTLQATSTDYPDVAAKVSPPGIAVLSKGGGIGFVSGGISESNLMQAYIASARTGGCGPGGCPPPGGGKAAVPCN